MPSFRMKMPPLAPALRRPLNELPERADDDIHSNAAAVRSIGSTRP